MSKYTSRKELSELEQLRYELAKAELGRDASAGEIYVGADEKLTGMYERPADRKRQFLVSL